MSEEDFRRRVDVDDLGLSDVHYFNEFLTNDLPKGGIKINFTNKSQKDSIEEFSTNIGKNSSPTNLTLPGFVPVPPLNAENGEKSGWSSAGFTSLESTNISSGDLRKEEILDLGELRRPSRNDYVENSNYDKGFDRSRLSERDPRRRDSRKDDSRDYRKQRRKSRSRSRSRDRYDSRRRTKSPQRSFSPKKTYPYEQERNSETMRMPSHPQRESADYFGRTRMEFSDVQPQVSYMGQQEWNTAPPIPVWRPNVVEIPFVETPQQTAHKKAVEKEATNLMNDFLSQKKNYVKKRKVLLKELGLLKNQRRDLLMNDSPGAKKVLTENIKLQEELNGKIQFVDNGLDMIKGLIRSQKGNDENRNKSQRKHSDSDSSGNDSNSSVSEEERSAQKRKKPMKEMGWVKNSDETEERRVRYHKEGKKCNYSYYDTEIHWCRPCKVFPSTAKDFLIHLHSSEHRENPEVKEGSPWHVTMEHEEPVLIPGGETKNSPIKGLQFFVGSTAWFCRLCQSWMGDFHCASLHIKSKIHNDNYEKFIAKNPKFEVAWLSERGKAVISCGKKEDVLKRQLEEQLLLQKKHEDEIRQSLDSSSGLVIPLSLQSRYKSSKSKKSKKGKKKRKRRSSDSSSSSSSSTSSSSSDEGKKKRKDKRKSKESERIVKMIQPQRSKWERDDEEFAFRPTRSPDTMTHPILEARKLSSKMRGYKWKEDIPPPPSTTASPPHVPEKHSILIPESTKQKDSSVKSKSQPERQSQVGRIRMRDRDQDDVESKFDRQAAAALNKKKQKSSSSSQKTKFAFIGRMPFAKKKNDASDTTTSFKKEQDVDTPDPTPPPPPVLSKKVIAAKTPAPVLTSKTKVEVAKDILTKSHIGLGERQYGYEMRPIDPVSMEMEMDIEKPDSPPFLMHMPPMPHIFLPTLPPEVTGNLGKRTMAVPLPQDFQDSLSILYPEAPPRGITPPPPPPPNIPMPSPPRIESPAPPPPQISYDEDDGFDIPPPPSPPSTFQTSPERFYSNGDEDDDMAMLGIDKEDMAAQRF